MISGAHAIIYTKNAEADKAFFRDVLKLPNVDVGRGWLIFGLPPSEIAMHPTDEKAYHELYLICDDIELFITKMTFLKIECSAASDQGWGILSQITLPGGGKLGVYQPRHARPQPMASGSASEKTTTPKPKAKKAGTVSKSKSATAKSKIPPKTRTAPKKTLSKSIAKKAAPAGSKSKPVAAKSKTSKKGRK
jgi:catechol 2,3-dioxygenase-like lactoylglutathione lyase family enzyme